MTADNSRAFFVSVFLHGTVLAVALYLSYAAASEQAKKAPHILELVAGPGDDFRATEAPAVGSADGVKLSIPKTQAAPPEPPKAEAPKPEPTKVETPPAKLDPNPPPAKTPPANAAPPKPQPKERTMAQKIRRQLIVAESRGKQQAQKEREAEQKRITKEEFDKAQRAKVASARSTAPAKLEKIDSKGIADGVRGGSANSTRGAGGNALSVEERSELDGYAAMLNQKLTEELDQVPGLDENLRAEAEFEVQSTGRLARGRILKKSGSERFDQAVLHAIAAVRMPEGPPKGFERVQQVTFSSKGKN